MAHPFAALVGLLALAAAPVKPEPAKAAPSAATALGARPAPAARPPPAVKAPLMPEPQFLFDIATANGTSDSTWATMAYDRKHDDLFVVTGGLVRIFNAAAMESYAFGGDGDLGSAERVALLESGEILLLTSDGGRRTIVRCDFRGDRVGVLELDLKSLPAGFAGFEADRIQVQGERIYLVQVGLMRVVVSDLLGHVEGAFDLGQLVLEKDPTIKTGMNGFWADPEGNLVFTMPYAFSAFIMSPSGELRRFGTRGSAPGKFNIVGSVAGDEQGNLFILDRLRSVVMVFDRDLKFLVEFGYRGDGPSNLIAPYDLAVGNGKVFVSQARGRGVKVFHYQAPAGVSTRPDAPAGARGG